MSNLRGGEQVFKNETTTDTGVDSEFENPGAAANVAVMVRNTGVNDATVTIRIAGGAPSAGRNNPPATDSEWHTLFKRDGSDPIELSVASGSSAAVDLSPFAAPYLRLRAKSTNVGDHTTVDGFIVMNGGS